MRDRGAHAFIVPAFGQSPYLRRCLDSLAAQTVRSPVLVTTSTPSAHIEAEAARIGARMIVNPTAGGIAADWNFALAQSPARYATLAHQDDVYFPRFGERSRRRLIETPEASLSFTSYLEIDEADAPLTTRLTLAKHGLERVFLGPRVHIGPHRMRAFLALGNPLACSSVTFDLDKLAGFRFSDAFRSNLDWDAWLRLSAAGTIFARDPSPLVGRRHNALTATARLTRAGVRRQEDLAVFRRLWPSPLAEIIAYLYRAGYYER
jgi:glycosyltransferase involved in cell wall biosynthesis